MDGWRGFGGGGCAAEWKIESMSRTNQIALRVKRRRRRQGRRHKSRSDTRSRPSRKKWLRRAGGGGETAGLEQMASEQQQQQQKEVRERLCNSLAFAWLRVRQRMTTGRCLGNKNTAFSIASVPQKDGGLRGGVRPSRLSPGRNLKDLACFYFG